MSTPCHVRRQPSRRPRLGRGALVCSLTLQLIISGAARADDTHYQDFLIGGRALGLGGAYTSLSDDPSGVFYNPAGIVDVNEESYHVSTSLYGFERGGINTKSLVLPVPGAENLDIRFTELIIVPANAGYVRTFGQRLANGSAQHAYAFNVLVPSFRSYAINTPLTSDSTSTGLVTQQPTSYTRRVSDRDLWSGLAYSYRVSPRLSFGVAGFYAFRSFSYIEEVSTSGIIDANRDGVAGADEPQVFRTATNDISFVNGSLVVIGGAKWRASHRLRLGLRLQLPSLRLHSQSSLRFTSGTSVPSCASLGLGSDAECLALLATPSSEFISRAIGGGSETDYAPAVRIGVSWQESLRYTVALDVSYHLPVSYELIRSRKLDDELRARLPFSPLIQRRAVVNINLGAEYLIVTDVSIAAGFFTDFSSAPPISANPVRDAPPRVNLYGTTVALGYFGEHSMSRLGLLYSFGTGQDIIPASDLERLLQTGQDPRQQFSAVDTFQSFFYFFLSTTFRY